MRLIIRFILISLVVAFIIIISLSNKPTVDEHAEDMELATYENLLIRQINQEIQANSNISFNFIRHTMHLLKKSPKLCDIQYQYSVLKCEESTDRKIIPYMTYNQLIAFAENTFIKFGGYWGQKNCRSDQAIAIIIPFRDRWKQIMNLLPVLHQILQIQNNCYRIFIVEQLGSELFNKGRLNNAGFLEAISMFYFDCVIFHDTDLIPESAETPYKCHKGNPTHMASAVDIHNYHLPYSTLIGGVIAFKPFHYVIINGYSNYYWGWGLEDDDLEMRLKNTLTYDRLPETVGRYRTIKHPPQPRHSIQKYRRKALLSTAIQRMKSDGLNSIQYKIVKTTNTLLYTHIIVDIGNQPKEFF